MNSDEQARLDLNRNLGRRLPDELWNYLSEKFYVREYQDGQLEINALADEARKLLRIRGELVPGQFNPPTTIQRKKAKHEPEDIDRQVAISMLLAEEARKEEGVRQFRSQVLKGKPLSPDKLEHWILGQGGRDGPSTIWIELPLPPRAVFDLRKPRTVWLRRPLTINRKRPAYLGEPKRLEYPSQNEEWSNAIEVTHLGVLDRLARLSGRLARKYGWQPAQATKFILTDDVPVVREINAEFLSANLPSSSRITLSIDLATSPKKVAAHYREVRKQVVKGRPRNLGPKHLWLAVLTSSEPVTGKAVQRMALWNKLFPRWRYREPTNFSRDCKQALARLLDPKYLRKNEE